jgi:L,D-peptidoglycan transpeptidase YkuD (ErfK/YbiS/YcfS/YnhG family)
LPYSGTARQVITVAAPSATSTTATLTAWARTRRGWTAVVGPVPARVGSDGVGAASEYVSRTPAGTYRLTQAFGRRADPGTRLPYFRSTPRDWWDENPASPTYNLHVRQWASPGGNSENLYRAGAVYDYVVNIDYNTARVPGVGSAIFLHITNDQPTAGCVAVSRRAVVRIMRWLRPADVPVIVIGVRPT